MIGRISGHILEKSLDLVLIDVNGVAYEVEIPQTTFDRLAVVGEQTVLHTHLVVREDAQLLYGFASKRDRELFRTLIKINKVGPKLGIAILSGLDVDTLIRCIRAGDVKTINGISGVGKVTAERIVLEMKNKLDDWGTEVSSLKLIPGPVDVLKDAESALIGLGFKPQDAARALSQLDEPGEDVETLIKQALRALA